VGKTVLVETALLVRFLAAAWNIAAADPDELVPPGAAQRELLTRATEQAAAIRGTAVTEAPAL